jgi:hypothetical protein
MFGLVTIEPPEGDYEVLPMWEDGKQLLASYPNGYGASVVQHKYSYGGHKGLYELAVLHGEKEPGARRPELCYATPITHDVIGWLTPEQVVALLAQIAALPRNDACPHSFDWEADLDETDDEHAPSFGDMLDSLVGMAQEGLS